MNHEEVPPEKKQKLATNDVNDEDNNGESDGLSEDLSQDEIEKMLDEALPPEYKRGPIRMEKTFITREKVFNKEKEGVNPLKRLPPDWFKVRHASGVPVYMHRPSKVCTVSKPYLIGNGLARMHDIPSTAIHCYAYRKALEEEETDGEKPVVLPDGIAMPPPRVDNTNWKMQHLTAEQINNYCKKLFQFKTVNINEFKSWADRRNYMKEQKTLQCPRLPDYNKIVHISAQPVSPDQENGGGPSKNTLERSMSMNTHTYLTFLHDYVFKLMRKQLVYVYRTVVNTAMPFQASVMISGVRYGVGYGPSKNQAKQAAARATLEILIPDINIDGKKSSTDDPTVEFFDYVSILNPHVMEYCTAACELLPLDILKNYLQMNCGGGQDLIKTEVKILNYQKVELTMNVGEHTVTTEAKNKKIAIHHAAQAILKEVHPLLTQWGSLLRLYGTRAVQCSKLMKQEEQQITQLQGEVRRNKPNYALLAKLRNDMKKLRDRDSTVVSSGTLLDCDDLSTYSGSGPSTSSLPPPI